MASVRRVTEDVYEIIANVTATVAFQGGELQVSSDRKGWKSLPTTLREGWVQATIPAERAAGEHAYVKVTR